MESKAVISESWVGLLEDGLDLLLFVVAVAYVIAANDFGLRLSDETMAYIATTGAGARFVARRIIGRIVAIRMSDATFTKMKVTVDKSGPES